MIPLLLAAPVFGVQYAPMAARFVGDLSDETTLAHGVQLKTFYLDAERWPIRSYVAIDVMWTATTHTGSHFRYPAGADLRVLAFLFRLNTCWMPTERFDVCLGLGQGTVNVNAPKDRRDWGTWNYQVQTDYALTDSISVFLLGQSIGEVEQEIAGVPAAFTILTAGGGIGAAW